MSLDYRKCRNSPTLGEVSESLQGPASLVPSENITTFMDGPGEVSAISEQNEQLTLSGQGGKQGEASLSDTGSNNVIFTNPVVTVTN